MTNAIEQTKREMYRHLEAIKATIKKGFSPNGGVQNFEPALEAHLEELRKDSAANAARIGELYSEVQQWKDVAALRLTNLSAMTKERDDIQLRLHAIDYAYNVQQSANNIAGEELIRAQGIARQYLDDCRSAEKLSDSLDDQLRDARQVISHQEQLIVGQRLAIAELHMARREVS